MFESKILNYYLRFTYVLLIILWVWGIVWATAYSSQWWDTNSGYTWKNRNYNTIIDYDFLTKDWVWDSSTIALEFSCGFSLIATVLFIYKFNQFITFAFGNQRNNNNNKNKQQQQRKNRNYDMFVSVISRTTVLGTIAFTSTVIVVIVHWVWDSEHLKLFDKQIWGILLTFDAVINVFCLNLNYQYAQWMYQVLKCSKLEKKVRVCILCCFTFVDGIKDKKCQWNREDKKDDDIELDVKTGVRSRSNTLNE